MYTHKLEYEKMYPPYRMAFIHIIMFTYYSTKIGVKKFK